MNEEAQNFVKAVQNDEYAEFELEENFILITDWEGDGMFHPYVVMPSNTNNEDKVLNLLEEETSHFMKFEDIEIVEQQRIKFAQIYGAELNVGETQYTDWFSALGNPVPHERRARAIEEAQKMGLELEGRDEMDFINPICMAIENDDPSKAISLAREELDLTGVYRLLAYLCVEVEE